VGGICDLNTRSGNLLSFLVDEFVELDTGETVLLYRGDRGFSTEIFGSDSGIEVSLEEIVLRDALMAVLPDEMDLDAGEAHAWRALSARAQARGAMVAPEDLRQLPYVMKLTERARAAVMGAG